MADQWYFSRNNQQEGPAPEGHVRQLVATGQLQPTDYVCEVGGTAWKRVRDVPTFNQPAAPARPAPPQPGPPPGGFHVSDTPQQRGGPAGDHRDAAAAVGDFGRQTYQAARKATSSAAQALTTLFSDPLGGQKQSVETLGPQKAAITGMVFHLTFVVILLAAWYRTGIAPSGFSGFMKMFLTSLSPSVTLTVSFLLSALIFGKRVSWQACFFLAGTALLPLLLFVAFILIVGVPTTSIVQVLVTTAFVFSFSLFVMLTNAALTTVHELTTRQAVLLTPSLLTITFFSVQISLEVLF